MRRTFKPTMLKALLAITVASFAVSSCDKMPPPVEGKRTILQTIAADSRFQFLTVAVHRAGLSETLDSKEANLTLFAPTDQAFKDAGFKTIQDVATAPVDGLKKILLYHVLGSEIKAAQIPLAANTAVNTQGGTPIYATRQANPTKVFINGVRVIQADLDCKNGVIHVIGRVLIPAVGSIVQTAQANPKLSYLVAAVLRASQGSVNVAAVLSGTGPFTVFAPTNDAFKNAGFPTIDAINAAPPSALTPILTYHVIGARIFSSDLTEGAEPTTVNGAKVKISLAGGPKVKGNSNTTASNIVITDIVCTNGVVHVIDQVLLP
jgi:uncharacterized surface protein with fasciclin (FAS1) repeats